jgi:branched-subunit amino acid aminotransferase/4-amino-4-deoxychorismate lyase
MSNVGRIWFNGELRESSECMVHVASHALHYGSSVFEGIRAYETPQGTMIFRGMDHLKRLQYSANVYRIPVPYSLEDLHSACRLTVRESGLKSAYIRPIIARGNCGLGVIPRDMGVVDASIMVSAWGAYLGEEGLKNGIRACITSWSRLAPNTSRGQLPLEPADRFRSPGPWIRGGHRPRHRRPAQRGRRREHLHRAERQADHAAGIGLDP